MMNRTFSQFNSYLISLRRMRQGALSASAVFTFPITAAPPHHAVVCAVVYGEPKVISFFLVFRVRPYAGQGV